jgi:L-fuculose-phosphate aldolase
LLFISKEHKLVTVVYTQRFHERQIMFFNQFQKVGQALFQRGMLSSQTGNLSIRMGDHLIITRRGANMGALQEKDLIETGINRNDRATPLASVELPVHRMIYQNTQARAIVHAHPTHVTAISMSETEISSDELEVFCVLGKVPVVGWGMEVKPGGLSDVISGALKEHQIVALRGHGTFAIGTILDEAFNSTTALEEACEVLCLMKAMQIQNHPART